MYLPAVVERINLQEVVVAAISWDFKLWAEAIASTRILGLNDALTQINIDVREDAVLCNILSLLPWKSSDHWFNAQVAMVMLRIATGES